MFDVFLSYGHADQDWVRVLAENLQRAGLQVFYDEWEIRPGDVLVHTLDEGIRTSRNGILVVSPAALGRPWVALEYAAMLTRAAQGQHRLIPVLLREAELPPLLASHIWVDFRHIDGPEYEHRVNQLVAALREERPVRPEPTASLVPPPGSAFTAEGRRTATLQISATEVVFTTEQGTVSHHPGRFDAAAQHLLWEFQQAQTRPSALLRTVPTTDTTPAEAASSLLHQRSLAIGAALTTIFLRGAAGEALAQAVSAAVQVGSSLALALEIQDELSILPWETLRLPEPTGVGMPLVLHPHIQLYRHVGGLGPTPGLAIRGPLRILVVIASPEADNQRGELLDYEAELNRLLDAVETPRREERAYVRILNRGTVRAVREALDGQRFHIVHLSCHARPGVLVFENEEGQADLVDAARFASEVLPPDRGVPLLVLSGCSTAIAEPAGGAGETALPSLARALLARGVPTVLAMTAPVTDPYATLLTAALYRSLSIAQHPDPLTAFSDARRRLEQERMRSSDQRRIALAEWATPTLFLRGPSQPFYDRGEPFETLTLPREPQVSGQMVVRQVGEFVGRRSELRRGRVALREQAGLVLHGLGGVGKSTLAAQVIAEATEETDLVVALSGTTNVDRILSEIGWDLLSLCRRRFLPDTHPFFKLSEFVREYKHPWPYRLQALLQEFAATESLLLLLDNFEDNLTSEGTPLQVADAELATFLATWVRSPGRARVLITSRFPFVLPEQAQRHLHFEHLGPLSWAETRKLLWRLPGLDALSPDDQHRAYQGVGGHPRTLEYLDALLRGGQARFADIVIRMEAALMAQKIDPAMVWQRGKGRLDAALAEATTLAVDDVVLNQLLERLDQVPLARQLVIGASVYRLPVDAIGLAWQIGDEQPVPSDPQRDERMARVAEARRKALVEGRPTNLDALGLSEAEVAQLRNDWTELSKPPLHIPPGFEQAKAAALELGLLAPVGGSETASFLVHRWTARALETLEPAERLIEAHHRAARYWLWRDFIQLRRRKDDLEQLLEARYHYHAVGHLDEALTITGQVCMQLETWGAYRWVERLCQETLTWNPAPTWVASLTHQLGTLAQDQGNYPEAQRQFLRSLAMDAERGDRDGIARSYHQLSILATLQDDYPEAQRQSLRSLTIQEELGDRAGIAKSYHQLGILAQRQGDYSEAQRQYLRCLAIVEEQGDRAGMAKSYHQLGTLAQDQGNYPEAQQYYQRCLAIEEELGDRAGIAKSHAQVGILLTEMGLLEQAVEPTLRSLLFHLKVRAPEARVNLRLLARQRVLLGEETFRALVSASIGEQSVAALLHLLDEQEREQCLD